MREINLEKIRSIFFKVKVPSYLKNFVSSALSSTSIKTICFELQTENKNFAKTLVFCYAAESTHGSDIAFFLFNAVSRFKFSLVHRAFAIYTDFIAFFLSY